MPAAVAGCQPATQDATGAISMASVTTIPERDNYLTNGYGIKSWLLTTDHKRIAMLYLASITFFFFIGGMFALLVRLELLTPEGDLLQADTYNKAFTMHGMIMVFFFLIPVVPAVLGNFLVPIMIGAKDLAFPRINLLSWYLYIIGGILITHCMLTGGVDTGWTFYTPYSTAFTNTKIIEAGLAAFVAGFSSIFTGLNFIVTVHRMRAPGHDLGPAAAVHLGELRNQHHHDSRHPGDRNYASSWLLPNACFIWGSSIRSLVAIRCCSSISSGSIRTQRFTS